jgi:hypothetical protein
VGEVRPLWQVKNAGAWPAFDPPASGREARQAPWTLPRAASLLPRRAVASALPRGERAAAAVDPELLPAPTPPEEVLPEAVPLPGPLLRPLEPVPLEVLLP